jgi:hypothetical protein
MFGQSFYPPASFLQQPTVNNNIFGAGDAFGYDSTFNTVSPGYGPTYPEDKGFGEALREALEGNSLAQGYAAADTPFDFSSGNVGGRVPRPKPLQMRTSGSLFGGYNPYIQGRK